MILHRRGENNDDFRNGVESVHAALAASGILKKAEKQQQQQQQQQKLQITSIGKNYLRNFPDFRQLY